MEEIVYNIAMIGCIILIAVFVVLIVVCTVGLLCASIEGHNKRKPKKNLNQSEIKHLYAQLKYYINLVDYYREKIDKIRGEK